MKKILFVIPIIFMLSGCYNHKELNDLAIVSAIAISEDDSSGDFKVQVQVVNPKKDQDTSSSNEPDFIVYKSEGKSLQEAFRYIIKESPKKIYGNQIQILIVDESIAKDNFPKIMDFLARDPEIRNEFNVLVSKDDDILEVLTPLDKLSSQNIVESLKANGKYLGYDNIVTFNDVISDYQNDNIELAIPSVKVTGDPKAGSDEESIESSEAAASVSLSTIAVFKDNKLVGYLSEKDSLAYNFVMGNVSGTIIRSDFKNDDYIVNELLQVSSSTDIDVKDNKVTVTVKGKSAIAEVNYDINLKKEKNIKKVQNKLNSDIEKLIKNSIKDTITKYNSDIYGFKDLYYKTDPKKFNTIKDKWYKEILSSIKIEVKSDIQIVEQGNLIGGLEHE